MASEIQLSDEEYATYCQGFEREGILIVRPHLEANGYKDVKQREAAKRWVEEKDREETEKQDRQRKKEAEKQDRQRRKDRAINIVAVVIAAVSTAFGYLVWDEAKAAKRPYLTILAFSNTFTVENIGVNPASNVLIKIALLDSTGGAIDSASFEYGNELAPGVKEYIQNVPFGATGLKKARFVVILIRYEDMALDQLFHQPAIVLQGSQSFSLDEFQYWILAEEREKILSSDTCRKLLRETGHI
ncbi:hypothetical protein HN588_16385 [Candidatus Bathyarchaeota archaeon]|nr:hypothetical protein [Candidatus Bathyarchaeota archaeon]